MLASELFKEFYWPTHHSISAQYLFFGLHGHQALTSTIWGAISCNIAVTTILTINPLRRNVNVLYPCCAVLFSSIYVEKGLGLVVPGFIPSPLGEVVEYFPTTIELSVSFGIICLGLCIFTVLAKAAIAIETGLLRHPSASNPH